VSLGSGQGDKDRILLEALRDHGVPVAYVPVDTSQALLEMACAGAVAGGFPTQGIKADLTREAHLAALAAEPRTPRSRSFGRPAARLTWIKGSRFKQSTSTPKAATLVLCGSSAS
jgi:uncharacterized SAM-dependent methyltransferase